MELGGGLEWTLPARGLAVEARGWTLAAHAGAAEEWGVSGALRLSPGPGRSRPVVRVVAAVGSLGERPAAPVERRRRGSSSPDAGAAPARLETELGYGIGAGVATPYTRLGLAREERRYRVGWRLNRAGEAFELTLEASRRECGTDRVAHGVRLDLRLRW